MSERESMPYDVVIVGAGPAGLAAAIRIKQRAAESGADYVSFGPVGPTGLGTGEEAPMDLFAWWSEMIEVPIVAEGGLDAVLIGKLAPITDFFAIGPEIWAKDDPMDALSHLWRQDK